MNRLIIEMDVSDDVEIDKEKIISIKDDFFKVLSNSLDLKSVVIFDIRHESKKRFYF